MGRGGRGGGGGSLSSGRGGVPVGTIVAVAKRLPGFSGAFNDQFSLQPEVTLWSIVVSVAVAGGVGIVFGIYPAIVASRKDPIQALRHD